MCTEQGPQTPMSRGKAEGENKGSQVVHLLPARVPTRSFCPPLTADSASASSQEGQVIFTKCSEPLGPNGPLCPGSLTGNQSAVSSAF